MWKPTFCLLDFPSEAVICVPSSLIMMVLLSRFFFFLVLLCDAYFTKAEAGPRHAKGRAHLVDNWRGLFPRAQVWRRSPWLVWFSDAGTSPALGCHGTGAASEAPVGLCGTNNYQLCSRPGTSNHSGTFHTCGTPANTFVSNDPLTRQEAGRKDRGKPCLPGGIAMETQCFHIHAQRRWLWIKTFCTGKAISQAGEALSAWLMLYLLSLYKGRRCVS